MFALGFAVGIIVSTVIARITIEQMQAELDGAVAERARDRELLLRARHVLAQSNAKRGIVGIVAEIDREVIG